MMWGRSFLLSTLRVHAGIRVWLMGAVSVPPLMGR